MFCAVGSFIERLHVSNLSIFWLCQTLLVNTRIFLHQTRPSPDFTLILAANKHFIRFSPIFVCQNEDGDGWKRHFSSPRYSVSLSCNLFRLFCTIITVGAVLCLWFFFQKRRRKIHARRSMSDFGWKREDYRTRQQRNNDNENGFLSLFASGWTSRAGEWSQSNFCVRLGTLNDSNYQFLLSFASHTQTCMLDWANLLWFFRLRCCSKTPLLYLSKAVKIIGYFDTFRASNRESCKNDVLFCRTGKF